MTSSRSAALAGRLAVSAILLSFAAYALSHLGGLRWNFDEGIQVQKAWLVADGYRLFDPIWTDQPAGHTLLLGLVFKLLGAGIAQARALTVGFGLVGMAAVALAARELSAAGRPVWVIWLSASAAALVLAVAPNYVWASRAVMIGIPTFSLATLAMAFAIGYARRRSTKWLVAASAALGLSLAIKVQMIYLGPLLAVLVVAIRWRQPGKMLLELTTLAVLGLGPLALTMLAFGPGAVWAAVFGTYGQTRSDYELDVAANLGVLATWLTRDNLGLVALGIAGALLAAAGRSAAGWLAAAWLVLTVVTPLQHTALWAEDHFEPLMFCLAVLAGLAIAELAFALRELARSAARSRRTVWVALGCGLALAVYLGTLPHLAAVNGSLASARGYENDGTVIKPGTPYWDEVQAEEAEMISAIDYIAEHSAPDDFVITDDQILAFHAGRRVPPELAALSSRRVKIRAISGSELIEISERYKPAIILPWKSQLIHYDSYAEWLKVARTADRSWTETRVAYLP